MQEDNWRDLMYLRLAYQMRMEQTRSDIVDGSGRMLRDKGRACVDVGSRQGRGHPLFYRRRRMNRYQE